MLLHNLIFPKRLILTRRRTKPHSRHDFYLKLLPLPERWINSRRMQFNAPCYQVALQCHDDTLTLGECGYSQPPPRLRMHTPSRWESYIPRVNFVHSPCTLIWSQLIPPWPSHIHTHYSILTCWPILYPQIHLGVYNFSLTEYYKVSDILINSYNYVILYYTKLYYLYLSLIIYIKLMVLITKVEVITLSFYPDPRLEHNLDSKLLHPT